MRKLLLTLLVALPFLAQGQTKPDSTYRLSETQIIQISQLLDYGLKAAGNSDKVSTKDYNIFARQVTAIDSLFRVRYMQLHPVKKEQPQAKKP